MADKPARTTAKTHKPALQGRGPLISGSPFPKPPPPLKPADFEKWNRRRLWAVPDFLFLLEGKEPPAYPQKWEQSWNSAIAGQTGIFFPPIINPHLSADYAAEMARFLARRGESILLALQSVVLEELTPEMQGNPQQFRPRELVRWAHSVKPNGMDVPAPLRAMLEDGTETTSMDTNGFSDELKIAIAAGQYVAGIDKPRGSYKQVLVDWLEKHHPALSESARKRIATLVNPKKEGGSPGYKKAAHLFSNL